MNTPSLTSPWLGTNLYQHIILLVASFAGGMTNDQSAIIASAIAGAIGAANVVRQWIVGRKWSVGQNWFKDTNNWTYLSALVAGLIPAAGELIPGLQNVVTAIISRNWPLTITAGFGLLSIAYYTFFKNKKN